jgi:hypothetical protein
VWCVDGLGWAQRLRAVSCSLLPLHGSPRAYGIAEAVIIMQPAN